MRMKKSGKNQTAKKPTKEALAGYTSVLAGVTELLDTARRASARAVNALMTATYWELGKRIVKSEQRGEKRAGYGEELLCAFVSRPNETVWTWFLPTQFGANEVVLPYMANSADNVC